ncbi:MAG: DEDD exonuclease domain-containing protein [Actinomycetota bacterium]|nr:DEDD exonuclease domain-containing protein [Actinomycetota bacterium]
MQAQRSFEDLGTPLSDVTFCVLDLETTGGSPVSCAITEVGACKVRLGEVVGTFHTLVNPGSPIPAFIRFLTGISDDTVVAAPGIEAVLPNLLEFVRDSVVVAHNARFDIGFLNAACDRADYPRLSNRVLDTAGLARKILAGEVPNNRLETLTRYLRCAHQPCHRAYADVLATTDVLHHLIERVAGFGVTTLEDLLRMSSTRLDGTFHKISLTDGVPRGIGIYRFIGAQGQTLYVGKASDLRSRVRSYFYGDPRRKIRDLLRETQRIDTQSFATTLEAEVAEARAIAIEAPLYNRAGKSAATWHVKVARTGRSAKISSSRLAKDDGNLYLGPFRSMRTARTLIDGLRDAVAIHRCAEPARCRGCAFSEMGRCGGEDRAVHLGEVEKVVAAAEADPDVVLQPLLERMGKLARQERFEEAAELRDRGALLERALERNIEARSLEEAGTIRIRVGDRALTIRDGCLDDASIPSEPRTVGDHERRAVSGWLRRHTDEVELLSVSGTWALPIGARPGGRFRVRSD